VAVRAIENAVKDSGGKKIDGDAVRAALFKHQITTGQSFGVLPDLKYTEEAPYPIEGLRANIGTVENGKYRAVATQVPVPKVTKW